MSWTRPAREVAGRALFFCFLVSLVSSCDSPLGPPDGRRFAPPIKFRSLWHTVETCAGKSGSFDAISWYLTEGSAGAGGQGDIAGSWWPGGNRIYIAEAFRDDEAVIRHEMLHALLRGKLHEPAFLGSCGDLVYCIANCISEAGGQTSLPGANSLEILPDELDVQLTILPPLPTHGGWTTVVVSARNTRNVPVWVDLSGRPGVRFECLQSGFRCGTFYFGGDTRAAFRAGETRREATVFFSSAGSYQIDGSFNTKRATSGMLVVP